MNFQLGEKLPIWTTQKINTLISLYKSQPCLYNCGVVGYKDNTMRLKVWQQIAQLLEMPKDDVVKKIRGLRTQYAREKAKVTSRAKEGHPVVNPWAYYESLSFLDEFVAVKKNLDSCESSSELCFESADFLSSHDEESGDNTGSLVFTVSESIKNEAADDDCVMIMSSTDEELHSYQSTYEAIKRSYPQQQPAKSSSKRKRSIPNTVKSPPLSLISKAAMPSMVKSNRFQLPSTTKDVIFPPVSRTLASPPVRSVQSSSTKDTQSPVSSTNEAAEPNRSASDEDDDIFAKYILSELRQIKDAHVKRIVKHRIQNIIFEAHCSLQS